MEELKLYFKDIEKQKEEKEKKMREIYKLSLKERKRKVRKELEKKDLDSEKIKELLLMDNTNENLLFRYILSLNKSIVIYEMQKYSCYIGVSKIKELQADKFGNKNQGYRNVSYKDFFFRILEAFYNEDKLKLNEEKAKINLTHKNIELNNQPFDLSNYEAFYFYLCSSLLSQINNNETNIDNYINCMQEYITSMHDFLKNYKKNNYEEEKLDINKFLTIFYSIVNLDEDNMSRISRVPKILRKPDDNAIKYMILSETKKIEYEYGQKKVEQFKHLIEDTSIFCCIQYKCVKNTIQIPEKCYLYDYIIKHNVFKKYETKLIDLLNIIFKSDLFRNLVKILYKSKDENMKYFFDEESSVEDFWNNNILFVPFKLEKVSGFSYKDTFHILFSFYKIKHFDSDIENEIFTLGAFIRVLIHETFGHLMISYFYYMFYVNTEESKNYDSPRMLDQIKNLNKKHLCKIVGEFLANKFYDNLMKINEKNLLKNKLSEEFENIIGKNYAEKLAKKLLEEEKKIDISNIEKEKFLSDLTEKIIDILIDLISEEYNKYINEFKDKEIKYKEIESGNLVEFLLFKDFSQYTTLKECLFLLDEKMYEKTNLFKFSSEFQNLDKKKNNEFLKELNNSQKIFSELFSQYYSFYETSRDKNDLVTKKSFREISNDNLTKKFDTFECFNFRLDREALFGNNTNL